MKSDKMPYIISASLIRKIDGCANIPEIIFNSENRGAYSLSGA